MLQIRQLNLRYGNRRLFDNCEFQINQNDRFGLVGPNGAGKTSLLKILIGKDEPDQIELSIPKDATIGYLPQEAIVSSNLTVLEEVESSATTIQDLRKRQDEAQEDLEKHPESSSAYEEAIHRLSHYTEQLALHDEHKLQSRAESLLMGLGFKMSDMDRRCSEFSGGWQMRIALAKLLLKEPDLLMLDEPTNHLDIHSLRWLESYLKSYEGALLIVSHDRRFLDNLITGILSIENSTIRTYTGTYSEFETQRTERKAQIAQAKKAQDRKIEQTERFIERFRAKATKATQVQSRIKQLEKVERIELEDESSQINFRFPKAPQSGRSIIEIKNIHKSYGDLNVLNGISLELERGDRLGLVGINGAGKSTLARILSLRESPSSGSVKAGHKVQLGYFAQDQTQELDLEYTVLETAYSYADDRTETEIRNILGAFLFGEDDLKKKVAVLSGGEKNRLALARLMLKPFNFLILDEPTNHLDMTSKEVLQKALLDFEGTLFIISHDRDFIAPIANHILEIEDHKMIKYPGTLEEYLWKLDQDARLTPSAKNLNSTNSSTEKILGSNSKERRKRAAELRNKLKPLRDEVKKLENTIESLENKIKERTVAMADSEFFKQSESAKLAREFHHWEESLQKTLEKWESTTEKIEAAENS